MADEFIVTLPKGSDASSLLVAWTDFLVHEGRCEVVSVKELESNLRWIGGTQRSTWPEDVTLAVIDGGLLLSVHSGTKIQTKSLIDRSQFLLNKSLGVTVFFEEA
jgi:hypothetical protein